MSPAAESITGSWDCFEVPVMRKTTDHLAFTVLHIQFLLVFCLTQTLHRAIFNHLGLPPLVSQLLAGIILSKDSNFGKNNTYQKLHQAIFPEKAEPIWKCIGQLGYTLSLFLIGVRMDLSIIGRTGKKAYAIGILGLLVPIIVSSAVNVLLSTKPGSSLLDAKDGGIIAVLMQVVQFPVLAMLLSDLRLLNSELGRLALSSSLAGLIVGVVGNILTAVVDEVYKRGIQDSTENRDPRDIKDAIVQVVALGTLITTAVFVMRPSMRWMIKQTPIGRPVKDLYLLAVIFAMLVGALVTDLGQQYVTLGAFIVGATVPDGPPLGSSVVDKFDTLVSGILQPFFVTTAVMRADFGSFKLNDGTCVNYLIVFYVGLVIKLFMCLACGFFNNMEISDSLALGFMMSSKGTVDLGTILLFKEFEVISEKAFVAMSVMLTISAIMVPLAVKSLYHPLRKYGGYQRRNIVGCKFDEELRILGCIYRSDNVAATVNFLRLCSHTKEAPIAAYILHLMKLAGRSHPEFTSHDLQKKVATTRGNHSEDVVRAFRCFEHNSEGVTSASVFTSITLKESMHEDICTLALDKLMSLIVLPFHRKYGVNGSIDSEDKDQRALNISVLERSPCSVAVFVDRGLTRLSSVFGIKSVSLESSDYPCAVALIFIGGSDDREALALAKRMVRGSRITVDVVRLLVAEDLNDLDLLDSSALKELQSNGFYGEHFTYMEKVVTDGAETAILLRSMVYEYDLMIVGRRYDQDCNQTKGLEEWSEVPELGIIGDLLSMPVQQCRASVLVVQQQRQWRLKDSNF